MFFGKSAPVLRFFCTFAPPYNTCRKILCIVIRLKLHIRRLIAALAILTATWLPGRAQPDSIEIGLITCSPHEEVYSLYGHSALRYHNLLTGEDLVFNYGIFNFEKPHFVLRFVFGLTDYELGVAPTRPFLAYYRQWGSEVTEQVLNLTHAEKQQLLNALAVNLQPANRIYRYNYFYDNCSTRPRDIIERSLEGRVRYPDHHGAEPTWRQMLHELTGGHRWANFGNDMLLGVKADQAARPAQQQFLPHRLMADFQDAVVIGADGRERPLVSQRRTLVPPGVQKYEPGFPLTPLQTALALLVASCLILACECRRRRTLRWWDAAWMLLQGLSGCVILVMLFSEHPTTSTNLLITLLNPLPLFFLPSVLRRHKSRWWMFLAACIALFFIGGFWQDYAEGMEILALCLLTRVMSHYRNDK